MQLVVIVQHDVAVVAGEGVDATIDLAVKNDVSGVLDDQAVVGHGELDAIWKNERIRHAVYASLLVPGTCESVAHSEGVCPSGV